MQSTLYISRDFRDPWSTPLCVFSRLSGWKVHLPKSSEWHKPLMSVLSFAGMKREVFICQLQDPVADPEMSAKGVSFTFFFLCISMMMTNFDNLQSSKKRHWAIGYVCECENKRFSGSHVPTHWVLYGECISVLYCFSNQAAYSTAVLCCNRIARPNVVAPPPNGT